MSKELAKKRVQSITVRLSHVLLEKQIISSAKAEQGSTTFRFAKCITRGKVDLLKYGAA
ncbi:hypothetical protein D9M71_826860 [compost metagenome]